MPSSCNQPERRDEVADTAADAEEMPDAMIVRQAFPEIETCADGVGDAARKHEIE